MKYIALIVLIIMSSDIFAQNHKVTDVLYNEIENASGSDQIRINIIMAEQYNIEGINHIITDLSPEERRVYIISELQTFAIQTQQSLFDTLQLLKSSGLVNEIKQLWICNMVNCYASPSVIHDLSLHQDIQIIDLDEMHQIIDEIETPNNENTPEITYNLYKINAPQVWELGFTGQGVIVGVLDSGVNYNHNDIIDNMWSHPEYPLHGWNFIDNNPDPMDIHGHGTHVAGIIAGNGASGTSTGVAPNAKIMAIKVITGWGGGTQANYFEGIQFALENGVHLLNISMGWRKDQITDQSRALHRITMDNVLAAGIIAVASAGNEGNAIGHPILGPPNNIRTPGNIPPPWRHPDQPSTGGSSAIVCVGATDINDNTWFWSSRGPVTWENIEPYYDYPYNPGLGLIRPDIVAPGVDILSLKHNNNDGYRLMDGTSMATPGVAGVIALMLSKNPNITPQEISQIIEETAFPLDTEKNNDTGSGRVDALAAISVTPCNPIIIEYDEIWNDNLNVTCDVIITNGATLVINSIILFSEHSSIIVEQGSKLIINGGTLTAPNYSTWQGIEVWGNRNAHQWPDAQGNYAQGYLELNDAIIENAIVAVSLWKPDDYSTTGGIIVADNSVFINNRTSVHAPEYRNYHPDNEGEMDYRATFTRCTFEIDEHYPAAETFYKHVDLSRVKGVNFLACNFLLSPSAPNVSLYNMGIGSYSAGFNATGICTVFGQDTCVLYDPITFSGLNWAINANNPDNSTRTFNVNRAEFNNNTYGIRVSGINNFTVLNSKFHIGYNQPESDLCDSEGKAASSYGIHMTGCTGFAIEENHFTKASGATQGYYTGILIAESQSTEQVYRNTFEGLSYGNYAVGKNHVPSDFYKGLAYFCNENTGNFADFFVEPDGDPYKVSGIQSKQGDDNFVTGNTFTYTGNTWHFFNGGDYLVGYYYCNYCDDEIPDEPKTFQVTDKPKSFHNNCPSHYGGGGGSTEQSIVLTTSEKQEAELEFAVNLSNYNGVKTLYDDLKDGGNTDAVIADIENAWPTDTWELRAELLGKSPHLSMEVLKAAADKTDVLPESIIFEVLAANPDELKKEELIKYLEDKADPLPEYMVNILRHLAQGTTYKTILEQHMAHYNQVKTRAAYDIVRSLLSDTISDPEQLRNWLDNVGGKRADEQIIATYLAENNYTNALALANIMPSLYAYSGNELTEHSFYMDLLNQQINLEQQQRSIFNLDSLEVANLIFIAENSQGTAGLQAKGILEYAYAHHFCNCLNISDMSGLKRSGSINPDDLAKLHGVEVNAHSNPASQWVAFNYTLPANAYQGEIKIVDAKGAEITSFTATSAQGQQIWDTRAVKPGVYFYTLSVGEFTKTGKLLINK